MSLFSEISSAVQTYGNKYTSEMLRHILVNYTDTEVGIRHPNLPVGLVTRDQGSLDIFAGPTRIQPTLKSLNIKAPSIYSIGKINYSVPNPTDFKINGRGINQKVHSGSRGLFLNNVNDTLDGLFFVQMGKYGTTLSSPEGGPLINPLPVSEVFQLLGIFDGSDVSDSPQDDHMKMFKSFWS